MKSTLHLARPRRAEYPDPEPRLRTPSPVVTPMVAEPEFEEAVGEELVIVLGANEGKPAKKPRFVIQFEAAPRTRKPPAQPRTLPSPQQPQRQGPVIQRKRTSRFATPPEFSE